MYAETAMMVIFTVIFGIDIICSIKRNKKNNEKVDGVESIDGITYLIKDTDVSYVMYKLGSTCISRNIKDKEFEAISENEGILTFGGINYTLTSKDIGNSNNIGAGVSYRITCEQQEQNVIMKVAFEKRKANLWFTSNSQRPEYVLNQAYHRFFKEVLDVQVVK